MMKKYMPKLMVMVCIVLAVAGLTGCGEYKKNIPGAWSYDVSYEQYAADVAGQWLSDALLSEHVDVDDYMTQIFVTVVLTTDEEGNWEQHVDEGSYNAACQNAVAGFKQAFMELLLIRAVNEGNIIHENVSGVTHEENLAQAEELFNRAMQMSFEDYIASNCSPLMPSYEEVNNIYSCAGTYKIDSKGIYRNVSLLGGNETSVSLQEDYLLNEDVLIFTKCVSEQNVGIEYPVSYIRVK